MTEFEHAKEVFRGAFNYFVEQLAALDALNVESEAEVALFWTRAAAALLHDNIAEPIDKFSSDLLVACFSELQAVFNKKRGAVPDSEFEP